MYLLEISFSHAPQGYIISDLLSRWPWNHVWKFKTKWKTQYITVFIASWIWMITEPNWLLFFFFFYLLRISSYILWFLHWRMHVPDSPCPENMGALSMFLQLLYCSRTRVCNNIKPSTINNLIPTALPLCPTLINSVKPCSHANIFYFLTSLLHHLFWLIILHSRHCVNLKLNI